MNGDLILHHYDSSPFSEKVRMVMGIKRLTWRSVLIPNIMPKPDLTPLTGGYRRTPVMQVGADIYCDTQVILAEIEARRPAISMGGGMAWAINAWADRLFFQHTVPIVFGAVGDHTSADFIKDREQLSGRPFDVKAMKAGAPFLQGPWRAEAGWIEQALGESPWMNGSAPGLADAAAAMNLWFLKNFAPGAYAPLVSGLPRLADWIARLQAIGHGAREEMSGAEALAVARAAKPGAPAAHDPADPIGVKPGAAVAVMADDYGKDRIEGRLVAANPERIVIARDDPQVGRLHVHFPRVGYVAMAI